MPGSAPADGRGERLAALRREAADCRACDLWERGTQTVFGAGPPDAGLVLVGEQPGDREDVEGVPFVGPAGRLLDEVLAEAGIPPGAAYVTNAVKHFRWTARGTRRIHETPNERERVACRPWLESELAVLRPAVVVALGATAAKSLLGPGTRVTRIRGEAVPAAEGWWVVATLHPSAVLRAPSGRRAEMRAMLVDDLRAAARLLTPAPAG